MNVTDEEMKRSFLVLRKATCNSELRSFQYQILHRAIVTNKYLYKCNIKDSDKCYFCGMCVESIEHLFFDCVHVQQLWKDFVIHLNEYIDLSPILDKKNYIVRHK